jgi:hypothetical protein
MSRYPYTYAADFIRVTPATTEFGSCVLSRADAARIRGVIAKAIGMDDRALAEKLADAYVAQLQDEAAESKAKL